jgi:hypothetical protein
MPVQKIGTFFPQANLTVEQPEGVETVEFDDGHGLKAKDLVDLGEATRVDHTDLHTPKSTNQFETPGPVSVVLEGYGVQGETTELAVQAKVVKPAPKKAAPKGTDGAEGK